MPTGLISLYIRIHLLSKSMWLSGIFNNKEDKKIEINEFHQIFIEYYPSLVIYALKFVDDIDISKDIVQEVLAQFWMESEKLRNRNLVKSYLYSAVKNKALNFKKRESRKTGLDELLDQPNEELKDSENPDILTTITFEELKTELEKAIEELPEQRKKIFKMSRFQQMKHKQIAQSLEISPKTVETQIYRALIFLRKKLKHYFD